MNLRRDTLERPAAAQRGGLAGGPVVPVLEAARLVLGLPHRFAVGFGLLAVVMVEVVIMIVSMAMVVVVGVTMVVAMVVIVAIAQRRGHFRIWIDQRG
jgi:hypothetical protein